MSQKFEPLDLSRSSLGTDTIHLHPEAAGGRGFNLIGHHEIMFPLLAAALKETLQGKE